MLDWLKKSFSPSLAVVLRSGDMLVLYPHHTETGESIVVFSSTVF